MALYCEGAAIILCVTLTVILGNPQLLITNDGSAVLGANVTFFINLRNYEPSSNFTYFFNDGVQNVTVVTNSMNFSWSNIYRAPEYKEGFYNMSVSVAKYEGQENSDVIASNYSTFELRLHLKGQIVVNRPAAGAIDVDEVAVGENITVAVQLSEPSSFLRNAIISYMWSIDYDPASFYDKNFTYSYSCREKSYIVVNVIVFHGQIWTSGIFVKELTVKDPVKNVSVSGNPFIPHGDILLLNVTCFGSPPFMYCARPVAANETGNFSCQEPIVSTTCSFNIQYYFRNYGIYHIGIYVSNEVKVVIRMIEVRVYNVSKKPQLSTVIIPIVCSLMTIIIIAGGVYYYVQRRNQIAIEVANFDFQDVPDDDPRTFFEQFFESLFCRTRNVDMAGGDGGYYEDEDEPLIGTRRNRRLSY